MNKHIKEQAAHAFTTHPLENVVYATSDGTVFLEREKNSASSWAKEKNLGDVITVMREAALAEEDNEQNVAVLKELKGFVADKLNSLVKIDVQVPKL